ncbi:MAG: CvpA family protein [Dehalococcoidales bacterium]|nr:CvpA family protein [Dehalococcoidales bacterium]
MNWLDIVLIVMLFIPIFTGLIKGLIKTALSFAGLIIGIVLAGRFHGSLAEIFSFTNNENVANILAFVLILVAVFIIALLIANLLRFVAKSLLIGWIDRLGGAIIGLLSGFLFLGAILAVVTKFISSDAISQSFMARIMLDYFPIVLGLLPQDFEAIKNFFQS